jgi:hypothetical protein
MMTPTLHIFTAAAAAATGKAHLLEGYDKAIFSLKTATSANFTLKFQGSWEETKPDFSSAASATNPWIYLNVINRDSGASVAGSTFVASAGTDMIMDYEINGSIPRWVCATISAQSAGTLTLDVIPQHLLTAQA